MYFFLGKSIFHLSWYPTFIQYVKRQGCGGRIQEYTEEFSCHKTIFDVHISWQFSPSNYHFFSVNVKIIFKTIEKVQKINISYKQIYFPYGKKCTAVNNFRKQLANTLRLFGKHNLIWLTSIRGMLARCSLFTCKLGLPRILWVNSLQIFSEYVANMIQDSKLNMQQISRKHSANMRRTCIYLINM